MAEPPTALPALHFRTSGMSTAEEFTLWRELMAPMYTVERAAQAVRPPRGAMTCFLLGEMMANRTLFGAQHVSRDKRLIDHTPDHVILQLWRTGGTRGEIAGRPASFGPGQVALADRRRPVDSRITDSDTLGIAIPRRFLTGIDLDALSPFLDPARNRLAAARITALYRRLPRVTTAEVSAVTSDFLGFLHRLFDRSQASDVLEGPELDVGLLELADRFIDANIGSNMLSPETLAHRLGVSRATLYRLFAPRGGIMRYITERRLLAIHTALEDPLEMRSVGQLSQAYGFSSLPVFSRSFRGRYGVSPTDQRKASLRLWEAARVTAPEPVYRWWSQLGR